MGPWEGPRPKDGIKPKNLRNKNQNYIISNALLHALVHTHTRKIILYVLFYNL